MLDRRNEVFGGNSILSLALSYKTLISNFKYFNRMQIRFEEGLQKDAEHLG